MLFSYGQQFQRLNAIYSIPLRLLTFVAVGLCKDHDPSQWKAEYSCIGDSPT